MRHRRSMRPLPVALGAALLLVSSARCSDQPAKPDTTRQPICGLCYSPPCCCSGFDSECGPGRHCYKDGLCDPGERDSGPDHPRPICGSCYAPPCCCSGMDSECGPGYYCYKDGLCSKGTRDGGTRPDGTTRRESGLLTDLPMTKQ